MELVTGIIIGGVIVGAYALYRFVKFINGIWKNLF